MRSLFLKVFFWFWATVILTGVALIITFIVEPRGVPTRWHSTLSESARYSGNLAVEIAGRDGFSAVARYLARVEHQTHMKSCLFDSAGRVIAGEGCGAFLDMTTQIGRTQDSEFSMKYGLARTAFILPGVGGKKYIFATELPAGPRAALGIDRRAILLQWGVALLVSGLICSLLTRYLTGPILQLRSVSLRLAAGDLTARANAQLTERRDELGDLIRDFNSMAARIDELVSRQRQLIAEVSHELRSPLARINVALDLARERKGSDPAFEQMQENIGLLDEMIGRILTIAKLDTSATQIAMGEVELGELVTQVVKNAEYELREVNGRVNLNVPAHCAVWGNRELLHSAVENVIRNAIRYTEEGTAVEVNLECGPVGSNSMAQLTVRDFGPGVPDKDLQNIFQPFYRVENARDRGTGGTGLGLAIADRVIRLHHGTIRAENIAPNGLRVEILLPHASTFRET